MKEVMIAMNNLLLIIVFGLLYVICFLSILKPDKAVNAMAKYFKWLMKTCGFEGEIKPTPKARIICRFWMIFNLVILSCLMYLFF